MVAGQCSVNFFLHSLLLYVAFQTHNVRTTIIDFLYGCFTHQHPVIF